MSLHTLTTLQKQAIIDRTAHYIDLANQCFDIDLIPVPIRFDLKGKSSGMFVLKQDEQYIRYNEIIFAHYFDDAIVNTVSHEVAHYVVHAIWGINKVKPHGKEWKRVMEHFDVLPAVTSRYDIRHLPLHQQRRHVYICECMTHQLSTTRHNKVQSRKAIYSCRQCHKPLKYQVDK